MATYLDVVNKVLKRLREPTVTTVIENEYSALIGEFVNDVKREVEDAWNWSSLRTTYTITTAPPLFNYVMTGSGVRLRIIDVYDDTNNSEVIWKPTSWFDKAYQAGTNQSGKPYAYNLNGVDPNGDTQVDIFPVPDGVYDIRVNAVVPQQELTADASVILVPYMIVVEGAVSRAMSERGNDGGNMDQELRYHNILADYIAIDSVNREDELTWSAV